MYLVQHGSQNPVRAYTQSVPERRVICLDELGPVSAKTYYGRIESWWKQLRSLALKGRRFERIDEVIEVILEATV